ncbi:uncharacterized protein ACHE_20699A [Aspergillus chevalieri]|uniref:Uncharacterized protein n=1 Tax=Aspergillus chevalieri TaxID=182096 RepID=A0A7R7VIC4_ASPCH|nr:uncharacterized protein ACHE_20699A [Aspergillus chevalieri]BCR85241.1 hypothetical protein ACHE_20699A [Aspergillus chevalieri]
MAGNSNINPIIAIAGKGSQYVESLVYESKGDTGAEVLKQSATPGGQIDFVLPNDLEVSPAIKSITSIGSVHNQPEFEDNQELGFVFSRYFTRALNSGNLSGHPCEVRPRGLEGVEEVLKDLKAGRTSATKFIFRIADAQGVILMSIKFRL